MKRTILLFYCLLLILSTSRAQYYIDTVYSPTVRTVQLWPSDAELEPPLLHLGGSAQLLLRFDQLLDQPEAYAYTIVHCDRNWHRDSLAPDEYIQGFDNGPIDNHQFSFTTLQPYINYYQTVPQDYSQFLLSGNYALIVYLADHPDSVLFTRRFRVVEDLLDISLTAVTPSENPRENQELSAIVGLKTDTDRNWSNPFYLFPYLQQNGRTDDLRLLPFNSYQADKLCYRYKPENLFFGGNNFRYFDISNIRTPMYNVQRVERYGGELFAILTPCQDRSRAAFVTDEQLCGGFKINVFDRTTPEIEADYVWVNITLPMEHPFMDGSLHVVGSLTDWTLGDQSLMEYNPKFKAYIKRLYLKQGYYSYQILFLPVGGAVGETARLEGNHYETPNDYTLYIYGRRPYDRYDRLLSVTTLTYGE